MQRGNRDTRETNREEYYVMNSRVTGPTGAIRAVRRAWPRRAGLHFFWVRGDLLGARGR
jgi:hypothetical protein